MIINCTKTRSQILEMIVDEWKRLNYNASYQLDGGDPWLANRYELKAEAVLDLMKVIGIEAYAKEDETNG